MAKRRTQQEWIEAAIAAFSREGVGGVKVERLARGLGVTKGSFYWHFTDRRALLDAVLEAWAEQGTAAIIDAVEASPGDAGDKLRTLWGLANGAGEQAFEVALREWGRVDPEVRAAIRRVDQDRMAYLRKLMLEHGVAPDRVEAKCLLMYSLLIGDWFIDVKHGRKSRKRVLSDALDVLLDR